MTIPAIILAAGASTRLGQPKQLLPFRGRTLLAHAVQTVRAADFSPIVVVLGYDPSGAIEKEAIANNASVTRNPDWQKGMGTSIRAGLAALPPSPAVLLMLCDQPRITPTHLQQLRSLSSPDNLVAAGYNDTVGPPAIIGRRYFSELAALPDAHGAKPLLLAHPNSLLTLPLPEAAHDIDTPDDLPT